MVCYNNSSCSKCYRECDIAVQIFPHCLDAYGIPISIFGGAVADDG